MRFFRFGILISALLLTGCAAETAPPTWSPVGTGVYRTENAGGSFEWTETGFTVRPDCTACAPVSFSFEADRYRIASAGAEITAAPSDFPPDSPWAILPTAIGFVPQWMPDATGWTAESDRIRLESDDGKNFQLTFLQENRTVTLIYDIADVIS